MADRITRADIVEVAVSLLAAGGLHALAMRRIAGELGVQQSALYWHFENKQQLLAAVAERIVAPVDPPDLGADQAPWSQQILTLGTRLRAALLAYPDGAELVATMLAFRLGAQRPVQQITDVLVNAGFAPTEAEVAASVLVHFVLGYTTDEQQHRQAAAIGAIEHDDHATASADERFARGLDLIVAGMTSARS
jgi:TetR/AcrR family transcriptional regulator, tetracycline repressor protein